MFRKISLTALGFLSLYSSSTFSAQELMISQPMTNKEFVLIPNEPQPFSNFLYWSLSAKCVITNASESESENNTGSVFSLTMLRKSGSLNGVSLEKGDTMDVVVRTGDVLHITAVSGAKVELINRGDKTIKAECSLA